MSIFFKPSGNLNIAADPSSLPQAVDGFNISSDALTRFKNMRTDLDFAKVRDGSSKVNTTATTDTTPHLLIEQAGTRYLFSGDDIYEDESSIASSLTSAQWSGILYNPYNVTTQSVFALNGTDRKKIEGSTVYEWGISEPTTAPTIAAGALTGLTGDYNAKYSYMRKSGTTVIAESNLSPAAAAAVTLANGSLDITWTASSDSQVTHVRVYRTVAGGSTYYVDQDVAIGATTVDSDTVDASLGTQEATTHDRPPLGSFVIGPNYDGICFIIKDNLLYYCLANQPEYWPSTYYVEVSPPQYPGQCCVFYNGQIYYLTKQQIYFIQGLGAGLFKPLLMESITGAQGIFGALAVQGWGIFHVGTNGIYLWTAGGDKNFTQHNFQPIFRGETKNGIAGASNLSNAILHQFKNKLYFAYPGVGNTYPRYCLVFNLENSRVSYYDWGIDIRAIENDYQNDRLLIADASGFIWQVEDTTETDDGGTAIAWEVESKSFTLQTRAHFPRYAKYDVDVTSGSTATGTILLNDASHQTHTITGSRNTKKRLVDTGNGDRLSYRLSGSGLVSIYAVEGE